MRSPRASARREVLHRVAEAKKKLDLLKCWWTAETTVYVEPADRTPGDASYQRERQLHEYPEMQRLYWASTAREIAALITSLQELREHCVAEYHKTSEKPPPAD